MMIVVDSVADRLNMKPGETLQVGMALKVLDIYADMNDITQLCVICDLVNQFKTSHKIEPAELYAYVAHVIEGIEIEQ